MNNKENTPLNNSEQENTLFKSAMQLAESTNELIAQYQSTIQGLENNTLTHKEVKALTNSKENFQKIAKTSEAMLKRKNIKEQILKEQGKIVENEMKSFKEKSELVEKYNSEFINSDEKIEKTKNAIEKMRMNNTKKAHQKAAKNAFVNIPPVQVEDNLAQISEDLNLLKEVKYALNIYAPEEGIERKKVPTRGENSKNKEKRELTPRDKELLQKRRDIRAATVRDSEALTQKVLLLHEREHEINEKLKPKDDVMKLLNVVVEEYIKENGAKSPSSVALKKKTTLIKLLNDTKEKLKHFAKKIGVALDRMRENGMNVATKKLLELKVGLSNVSKKSDVTIVKKNNTTPGRT
ncbi:hypothetical protein [Candidatus Fokinia crypta]|uniref:Uncharacterized protein n=1 Tax=Candidatus Fokinia crypta TaxID=1920990 RepID=A0ABZ0UPP8_9RICK|nr:hypothetical protein [Candidatus Fokinia cryptica]WPX98111.1 hypothetical protein Fokcrypt_00645 [Candidatus Fokinia cryptica]